MTNLLPTSAYKDSGIYVIRNTIDNRVYIGSAYHLKSRLTRHVGDLVRNKHHCKPLQNFANKYGVSTLSFHLIMIAPKEGLHLLEQSHLDGQEVPLFNVAMVVGSPEGIKHTQASKDKISKTRLARGIMPSPDAIRMSLASRNSKYLKDPILTGNILSVLIAADGATMSSIVVSTGHSLDFVRGILSRGYYKDIIPTLCEKAGVPLPVGYKAFP